MKVVHITPTYFSPESVVGGGERYPLELARAMSRYVSTEVVSFGTAARRMEWAPGLPLTVYRRWNKSLYNPVNPRFLRSLLGADVIHIHQFSTYASNLALLFGKLTGKRVFATDLGGGGRNLGAYVNITGLLDGYLVISQNQADLSKHVRSPITIIYAGVDTSLFRPSARKERKVIFIGRYIPNKGIDYLIEAVPPDLPLHLIGGPTPEAERYYEDLKRLADGKQVRFMSGLTDEQIRDEYSSASVLVLPSVETNRYGGYSPAVQLFALTLVEAMACETVPIATNLFAHPEIIEDGVNGFLVPPNDPAALRARIEWVLDHPDEARAMARAGREQVTRRFTWDAVARAALDAYGWKG